jgi:hypothetical protein
MWVVKKENQIETKGSLQHCISFLLMLCILANHDSNIDDLIKDGWIICKYL